MQQTDASASCAFCQTEQRIQLAAHHGLELFAGCLTRVNHAALVHHIAQAIGHPGIGGQAVAPCPACFLVVAFNIFWHVQMRDKAHVGLVDTHAKRNGGHHHHAIVTQKFILPFLPQTGVKPGVIGHGIDACALQCVSNFFYPFAGLAIHNTCLACVL